MKRFFAASIILLIATAAINAQSGNQQTAGQVNRDPERARLVTSDIENFWKAYDLATPDNNLNVFKREYFEKASPGLKDFIKLRIGSVCALVDKIESAPRYYASMRASTLKIAEMRDLIRASLSKLKAIYADAIFPDVYFVIGRMTSGGTVSSSGLLIGAEMHARTENVPNNELNDWEKVVIKPISELPAIVAHELIHFQENHTDRSNTLLKQAVKEGMADFFGEMISGKMINDHLHSYGNPREKELWQKFKSEMMDKKYDGWLYNANQVKDRPADLGYYIGYKIAESYYNNAADKKQAIFDMLHISDFDQFLKESKYADKFER